MNERIKELKEKIAKALARASVTDMKDKSIEIDAWMNPRFRCSKCLCEGMHKNKNALEEDIEPLPESENI